MNPPKCSEEDYIQWLVASPRSASCVLAAEVSPGLAAHDAYTRLLERLEPTSDELWNEVAPLIDLKSGWLIIDDSTLEKIHARLIELVTYHWSGNKKAVVRGINLITLLWTNGDVAYPVDWRVYHKESDGLTKNDHVRQMLEKARERGFRPRAILWDSWYTSTENLKLVRDFGWPFFVGIRSNRMVSVDDGVNQHIGTVEFGERKRVRVHLQAFGFVYAYKYFSKDEEEAQYFIGSEALLDEAEVKQRKEIAFQIENYHRAIKQECHVQRCQARSARKQLNHIGLALRAYVRLAYHSYSNLISIYRVKFSVWLKAASYYLKDPICVLPPTA